MDPSLDQARRRAKELLRAARAGDPRARARLRRDRLRLADAQRAVAADLGHASWPALLAHVETTQGDRAARRDRLLGLALGTGEVGRARWDRPLALLEHDPRLADDLAVALVAGELGFVRAALDADPGALERELRGRRPLLLTAHSALLAPDCPRAEPVLAVLALLLERGADPDATFPNAYGDMSAVYGAAGVAHSPAATRLLLAAGADPDDGESVYHAAAAPDPACLEILLDHGATVRGTGALGNAIRRPASVRVLLEHGDLRPEDEELRTMLHYAREDEVAGLLLAHGADPLARDRDGLTPHDVAARFGDTSLLALLEAAGGRPDEPDAVAAWVGEVLAGRPHAPRSPGPLRASDCELLPMMASGGDDEGVCRLLDAGVPLDSPGIDGTAIHYACLWGRPSTLAVLLARGDDPERKGDNGRPLGYVAWGSGALDPDGERTEGYLACAEQLLARGVAVGPGVADMACDELSEMLAGRHGRAGG